MIIVLFNPGILIRFPKEILLLRGIDVSKEENGGHDTGTGNGFIPCVSLQIPPLMSQEST
jgi:hypothetical protein